MHSVCEYSIEQCQYNRIKYLSRFWSLFSYATSFTTILLIRGIIRWYWSVSFWLSNIVICVYKLYILFVVPLYTFLNYIPIWYQTLWLMWQPRRRHIWSELPVEYTLIHWSVYIFKQNTTTKPMKNRMKKKITVKKKYVQKARRHIGHTIKSIECISDQWNRSERVIQCRKLETARFCH